MLQALWPVVNQFQNKNGSILTAGKVYVYYKNRTTLAEIFSDEEGTVVNANPVLLDNNGRATVFADSAYAYTIVVCDYYGKELFSQDITLHNVTATADEINITGSDGSILINRTTADNVKAFDLYANTNIIATKQSVDDLASRVSANEDDIEDIKGDIEDLGTYTEGDAIDLTDNTISVKYSSGLEVNDSNNLQVKVGQGLTFDNSSNLILNLSDGLYLTQDGKLTITEPDENFIDITDEWVFDNGFRLQYNGSTPGNNNNMTIIYSPISDTVKFKSDCRINRTSVIDSSDWNVMLRYIGTRFYTTYNAPNSDSNPRIISGEGIGGVTTTIGCDINGGTGKSLLKFSYVGSSSQSLSKSGLAISPFINPNNESIYGTILKNLTMHVTKRN